MFCIGFRQGGNTPPQGYDANHWKHVDHLIIRINLKGGSYGA